MSIPLLIQLELALKPSLTVTDPKCFLQTDVQPYIKNMMEELKPEIAVNLKYMVYFASKQMRLNPHYSIDEATYFLDSVLKRFPTLISRFSLEIKQFIFQILKAKTLKFNKEQWSQFQ